MSHEKIPPKRLRAWMIAAASAPLASLAGGSSWLLVLLAALGSGIVSFAVQHYCGDTSVENRAAALLQWIWLGVFLGIIAKYSADCWPDGNAYPVVPLVLIVLSCISAGRKGENGAKTGAILVWFVVILLGAALGAGAKDLKTQWMAPKLQTFNPILVPLFLIPCLSVFLPAEDRKAAASTALCTAAAGVIPALWVQASLSPHVAAMSQNPLYEYCKSISLFGTVERFESLVSCALTAGWFCLFSFILAAAGHVAEKGRKGWHHGGTWACGIAAATVMLLGWKPNGWITTAISILLWAGMPLAIKGAKIKKSKKSEKEA